MATYFHPLLGIDLKKFFFRQLDGKILKFSRELWIYNSQALTFQCENSFILSVILTLFWNYPSFKIFVRFGKKMDEKAKACTLVILFQN